MTSKISSAEKKTKLLEMAKNGEAKPSKYSKDERERKLCCVLMNYVCKLSSSYDEKFTEQLEQIAPHWINGQKREAAKKRQMFLNLARDGAPKPCGKMWQTLQNLMRNQEFRAQLQKLAPDWFIKFI
jgi:hypothetical protein